MGDYVALKLLISPGVLFAFMPMPDMVPHGHHSFPTCKTLYPVETYFEKDALTRDHYDQYRTS
jgi:hypothetical protein